MSSEIIAGFIILLLVFIPTYVSAGLAYSLVNIRDFSIKNKKSMLNYINKDFFKKIFLWPIDKESLL